jgi:hypothetical protein
MLNGCMATKSHFWFAMSSIATLCLASESSPSNQSHVDVKQLAPVFGRLFCLGHTSSLADLLEKAAFSAFSDRPAILLISAASAGERLRNSDAAATSRGDLQGCASSNAP